METPLTAVAHGWLDWKTIAFAAAGISVFGSAMLIILSRMFNLKNLEQTAKTEFVYAASTVFIVLMVIGMLGAGEFLLTKVTRCIYLSTFGIDCSSGYVLLSPAGEPLNTLIDYMKLYMEPPVGCAKSALYALYIASIPVESIASVYVEVFMSEPATGFGIKAIAERLRNATQMISFYIWIYYVIIHAMNFIKYYAGFFFAVGVALRAFPPTRGAGAYLMAASVGFYLVLPFAYILVAGISLPHAQSDMVTYQTGLDGSPEYICKLPEVPDVTGLECGSTQFAKVSEAGNLLDAHRDELATLLSPQTGFVQVLFKNLLASMCLAPLIAMMLVMTFILNTTNLFGGNIPEIGRGLVKLI